MENTAFIQIVNGLDKEVSKEAYPSLYLGVSSKIVLINTYLEFIYLFNIISYIGHIISI